MTSTSGTTLLVIAKEPVAGKVKTRLTPGYTAAQAASLAEAALADTLDLVNRLPVRRRVLVLDGRPGDWLPSGFDVLPQHGTGLDERIANAFAAQTGPVLLIGMDTPQLSHADLAPALHSGPWPDRHAWIGPAADGGFWALGMDRPRPELVRGVPMSRGDTGRIQRERLVAAGLDVHDLPVLRDVDTPDDVAAAAAATPHGRFAAEADRIRRGRDRIARPRTDRDTRTRSEAHQ